MKLLASLKTVDNCAVNAHGISILTLMENAGQAVADFIRTQSFSTSSPHIVILCGKGQNGGDGYVCARLIQSPIFSVTVIDCEDPNTLTVEAKTNSERLKNQTIQRVSLSDLSAVNSALSQADCVVDAIFGSGLSRELSQDLIALVEQVNRLTFPVIAIDLPTGISAGTGEILGAAIKATHTLSFVTGKPGLYLFPGKAYAGEVLIKDIGIPPACLDTEPETLNLITPDIAQPLLPPRQEGAYKNKFGHVLVIGGSRDMGGSIVMTATAALKSGAGLVTLASVQSSLLRGQTPLEVMTLSLPETEDGCIAAEAFSRLEPMFKKATVVALGPGMSQHPETIKFVESLLKYLIEQFSGPVVIDADGLNILSGLNPRPALTSRFILTPHIGEAARLLNEPDSSKISNDLISAGTRLQSETGATVVLKSAVTVVFTDKNQQWINSTGNNGMATAGCGDVLTGMIAGLVAQMDKNAKDRPHGAAIMAPYLHGLSGDIALEETTPYCLTATDLIHFLPDALHELLAYEKVKA